MNVTLSDYISTALEKAPKCANFAALQDALAAEYGTRNTFKPAFDGSYSRWNTGAAKVPDGIAKVFESIGTGLKVSSAAPSAPKPEPEKPSTQANAPTTPKVTMEGLGKTVNALATDPSPSVRTPVIEGIQKSIAMKSARPDFSFLHGMERTTIAAEFDRLGGLSEKQHRLYSYRRQQWCTAHRMTPEQVSGLPLVSPEMITSDQIKNREDVQKAAKHLPGLTACLHKVNARIVEQHSKGRLHPATLEERKQVISRMNACEKLLGKPLTA